MKSLSCKEISKRTTRVQSCLWMKISNSDSVFKESKIRDSESKITRKYVKNAQESIWKKKTSTGLARPISLSGAVTPRCGGAAVRLQRRPMGARLRSTRAKMMKRMMQLTLTLKRNNKNTSRTLDASAARK